MQIISAGSAGPTLDLPRAEAGAVGALCEYTGQGLEECGTPWPFGGHFDHNKRTIHRQRLHQPKRPNGLSGSKP